MAPTTGGASVADITFSSAVFNAIVNAHGQSTNYYFQYGSSKGYGAQTPLAPVGNETHDVDVSQPISGLQPATTYHYRVVAVSLAGTTDGTDHTFATATIPLSVHIVGSPNPVVFGDPFFVEGTLSGTGAASRDIVLQTNPFPYLAGFQTVGNAEVTNPAGDFYFPFVGLLQSTRLRVVTVGRPEVSSPVVAEGVAVRVSFQARATKRHGFARLYGRVAPAEVGALAAFQLLKPGHKSVNVGGTVVKPLTSSVSQFSRVVRVHRGLYEALVRVSDGGHVSSYSAPILVR